MNPRPPRSDPGSFVRAWSPRANHREGRLTGEAGTPSRPAPNTTAATLRRFRAFHEALQAIKDALRNGDWTALLTEPVTDGAIDQQLLQAVRTRLIAEIGPSSEPTAATDGTTSLDPGHVMAIIADETLLHDLVWPGQQGWAREPLEKILYGTTDDSDQIVRAIDAAAQGDAPADNDVISTIRLALDLGYLNPPDDAAPASPGKPPQRLFEIVFRPADPAPLATDDFMTGAVQPLAGQASVQLPALRPWLRALGAVVAAYLLVSLLLWWTQVSDAVAVAAHILASLHPPR